MGKYQTGFPIDYVYIHNNEGRFVIADVVAALIYSVNPQGYLKDMRRRDPELVKGWG